MSHPLRVAVTGAGGFIGRALVASLRQQGHQVLRLVRHQAERAADEVCWEPARAVLDLARLEGTDAVIHLAGENVGVGRWNSDKKRRILESRVLGTETLVAALLRLAQPPAVLLSASAVGFYGGRGDELLDEASGPGETFLAQVCQAWESAARPAEQAGMRLVRYRIGVVLGRGGGALQRQAALFRWGLGGRLATGVQYTSWISLFDLVRAMEHGLVSSELSGPVNAVAPNPVTNLELTRTLARVLRRPAWLPVPGFALRLVLGEFADELLRGQRALPVALLRSGFEFRHPDLESALCAALC
jgi:uncharacterized protein (TIGR01777 family)